MQLGMIGLGRMGANIVRRLIAQGHSAVVYDQAPETVATLTGEGVVGAHSISDLVKKLNGPRVVWIMLPSGSATEGAVEELSRCLALDDIMIDGGNTFWQDDIRRAAELRASGSGVHYVDIGTSGGVWGLERGYCLMIGGDRAVVQRIDPILKALAPGLGNIPQTSHREGRDPRAELGYIHAGPVGAGHFVKMIHNGIEYGLMQAYAEGFDILRGAANASLPEAHRFDFDLADISEVWRRGSVVTSWLLDLTATALAEDRRLDSYSGYVEDSGEGRWTINAAIDEAVPAEVLTAALYARFRSRQEHTFAEKILSAMRAGFGGHREPARGSVNTADTK
jgi:6-phosphogluconate dehydrogenase